MLRPAHQQRVADILRDPQAVKRQICRAAIPAKLRYRGQGVLPTCRIPVRPLLSAKGQRVWTGGGDEAALARGVYNTYMRR